MTLHLAVSPLSVVAVIDASPVFNAVNVPSLETDTTEGLLEVHLTDTLAWDGAKLYFNFLLSPTGKIKEVRGMGLMLGAELSEPIAKDIQTKLFERKYLTGAVGTTVLRLLPPLVITEKDIDEFINVLKECLIDE